MLRIIKIFFGVIFLCFISAFSSQKKITLFAPDNLKYDEVSFKASHNSYDRDEPIQYQLVFHNADPSKCGCRALELDIWRHSDEKEKFFTVSHSQIFGEGKSLASYFSTLLTWHKSNPGHDVILITIDIKSSGVDKTTFPKEIDNYLKQYFNSSIIFKPSALFYNMQISLCQNVVQSGWPALSAMKDKFIFCLSGTDDWKNYYASLDPYNQLCFSDKDF